MTNAVGQVVESPVTTWVTIVVGAVVIIAMALPKVLGPLTNGLSTWAESQRRRSSESEDARINEMGKDIDYLKTSVNEFRESARERDRLAMRHMVWDHQMITRLQKHDHQVPIEEPPPLFPIEPTAPSAATAGGTEED